MMVKRNDPTAAALASVVQLLILEISGALNAVVAALGLSEFFSHSFPFCLLSFLCRLFVAGLGWTGPEKGGHGEG